jgi:hypothetical protein
MTERSPHNPHKFTRYGRVEQYHTHTRIVDGYKTLPVPVGMNLYPYSTGTHTH